VSLDEVLFIYGPGQPPMTLAQSGDQALIDHFTAQGYTVNVRFDNDPGMVQDAQTAALIYISETVASGNVVTTFANGGVTLWSCAVPILCAEPYLYDDLRLAGPTQTRTTPDTAAQNGGIDNGDHGNLPDHNRMNVVNAGHPLAAGFAAGVVQFAATPVPMGYGMPGPGATVVARCDPAHPWAQNEAPNPALATRAVLFVYEPGAALVGGGTAPARRVGLPGRHVAANEYNPAGFLVLDTAVAYAAGVKRIMGGSAWSNAAAWFPTGLPAAGDFVLAIGPGVVTSTVTSTVARLTVSAGTTLDVTAGTITVNGDAVVRGILTPRTAGVVRLLGQSRVVAAGRLELATGGTLRLDDTGCVVEGELRTNGGTIAGEGATNATRANLTITTGTLRVNGLTFTNGDTQGLHVQAGATIARLRGCAFTGTVPDLTGAAFLTIEQPTLHLSAPGCTFAAVTATRNNVRLVDTNTGTAGDVVLNLELRGAASGAGAGPARHAEVGGALVNWVHSAPDTTAGVAAGFPQVTFDLASGTPYAMYAAFRDAVGTTDRIYALDHDGEGVDLGYSFDVPAALGDIVGYPWWDQQGGVRVLFVVTTTGRLLRFHDTGVTSSSSPALSVQVTLSGQPVSFTSPPITDPSYVYVAGLSSTSQPRFFALNRTTGALAFSVNLPYPVTSELGTERLLGITKVFAGGEITGGGASTYVNQNFNANANGFSYADDLFAPTSGGGDESGDYRDDGDNDGVGGTGCIRVRLRNGTNLSGGYSTSFTLASTQTVQVTFAYRLFFDGEFDFGETGFALCELDGTRFGPNGSSPDLYLHTFTGSSFSNTDSNSGWLTHQFSLPLGAGSHTLELGGIVNSSGNNNELAYFYFDNVVVTGLAPGGIVYRVNTQTQGVEADNRSALARVVGAPFPAFGTGTFVGSESGQVLGIDHSTPLMADLPGWPVQPDATPVRGNVTVDFVAGRVFWGNEAGRAFGYDVAGASLFAVTPALGGAPLRGGLYDYGSSYWVSNTSGRLAALNVATGAVVASTSSYRFGAGVAVSQVAQDWNFRPMVTTSTGKLLVVDALP
jgi:hypothetical protein